MGLYSEYVRYEILPELLLRRVSPFLRYNTSCVQTVIKTTVKLFKNGLKCQSSKQYMYRQQCVSFATLVFHVYFQDMLGRTIFCEFIYIESILNYSIQGCVAFQTPCFASFSYNPKSSKYFEKNFVEFKCVNKISF